MDAKRSEKEWPGTFESATGLLFFGTPFRGSGRLNQVEMIRAAQSQYEDDQVAGENLNILASGNENLMDLMDEYFETREGDHKAHTVCFFELKLSNMGAIPRGSRIQVR